jgi:hypothetical protein
VRAAWLLAVLLASIALGQTARIVLRWKEVSGATAYEIQIAKDASFVEIVQQTRSTVAGYRWEHLPSSTHWWRVRSFDAEGRASEWSAPKTIAVDSEVPAAKRPEDGARLACGAPSVEFEVEPSKVIKEYVVEVSSTADFAAPKLMRGAQPSFTSAPLTSGTWWWRTRGVDLKGREVGPGPVRTFVVRAAAPKVKPTADGMIGPAQVQLAWADVPCATSWVIEATTDGRNKVSLTSTQTAMSFKPGMAGDYRWRVAGVDEQGQAGEWSLESQFRIRLPTPQPRSESVDGRAELSWSAVPTATSYRVELHAPATGSKKPIEEASLPGTTWRSKELPFGQYTWRVAARDAAGHTSAFSEPRSIARSPDAPLSVPLAIGPAGDAIVLVGAVVDLEWQRVEGATQYEVEFDREPLPVTAALTLRTAALAEGAHVWRIRAYGEGGRSSPWSERRELYAGAPPVVAAEISVVGKDVRVALRDAKRRLVSSSAPLFSAKSGHLSAAQLSDGRWTMKWSAPIGGRDVLVIDDRSFHDEREIRLEGYAPVAVSFAAGGIFDGSAVASPTASFGAAYHLPFFDGRPTVGLRVGILSAATMTTLATHDRVTQGYLVPLSLAVGWTQPLGAVRVRGSIGPTAAVALVRAEGDRGEQGDPRTRLSIGVEAALALGTRFGPGHIELEVGGLYAPVDAAAEKLLAGGVALRLGYVVDVGGGS